ncbi:HPr family phosphocarrier protein [Candidatus Albibeggiatoa sp. nov. BB20]|uniref:HPr family phosphocarrier protein n=1 Tax=Candidatus Albibeggiatoa sp. nov. BB20 TaxID=3162723 RepID=UPI0033656CE5
MLQETLTIVNKLGLHARAAAKLVKLASTFSSEIHLKRKQREVNGKSIMGVMLLAAGKGSEVELSVSGDDEEQAFQKIVELIKSGFGEEE